MKESHRLPVRFYFALPRLLAMLRGGDTQRAEMNATEAWVAAIAIYMVSFAYFAGFIPDATGSGPKGLILITLAFAIWLFWLLALYLNSLILKLLGQMGLFQAIPTRRGQSILVVTTVTAMALALLQTGGLVHELGAIWLTAVTMNLAAALILAFRVGNGDSVQG